ncbi:hypothetical protein CORC01_11507 [Colletotrichum orchidophilum]|uniref:Uncharacterized protein n=1 Tax=Colletotrichum orchidophilum TaxID=1209926 RepID=A0A1G4AVI8_9PEZI|nr:uncharacterized protein CORC01_11507 [Colletotrichum orchidophilum]OHE93190.1 hypothetical protein CORC01_11507 [Colletotrichum orchidophilum]
MTNDEMRGGWPTRHVQKVRPDTRKRRDENQNPEKKKPRSQNHVYLRYCSRSGLDALTSFASLRKKKIGWWGFICWFLFLFLLLVSSGSSFLPILSV